MITGDSLLIGDAARPDLASEAAEGAAGLYGSLQQKLLELPDGVELYPVYVAGSLCGAGMSSKASSTIGFERRFNHALNVDQDEFVLERTNSSTPRPPNMDNIVELNRGPFVGAQEPLGTVDSPEPARCSTYAARATSSPATSTARSTSRSRAPRSQPRPRSSSPRTSPSRSTPSPPRTRRRRRRGSVPSACSTSAATSPTPTRRRRSSRSTSTSSTPRRERAGGDPRRPGEERARRGLHRRDAPHAVPDRPRVPGRPARRPPDRHDLLVGLARLDRGQRDRLGGMNVRPVLGGGIPEWAERGGNMVQFPAVAAELREIVPPDTALAFPAMQALRPHYGTRPAFVQGVDELLRAEGTALSASSRTGGARAGGRRVSCPARARRGRYLYVDDRRRCPRPDGAAADDRYSTGSTKEPRLGFERLHLDSAYARAHRRAPPLFQCRARRSRRTTSRSASTQADAASRDSPSSTYRVAPAARQNGSARRSSRVGFGPPPLLDELARGPKAHHRLRRQVADLGIGRGSIGVVPLGDQLRGVKPRWSSSRSGRRNRETRLHDRVPQAPAGGPSSTRCFRP